MSIGSLDYALLAADSYKDPTLNETIELGGVRYQAIAHVDRPSGYQGTAYQRIDTGEIVIASRGTEFGREPIHDGAFADGGMVFTGYNNQANDAMAFTRQVVDLAKAREAQYGHPLDVTVTGHSLGGTLAEITASKFGLHGETFNAYGAAGLLYDVPEGGHQVIDHVRATDMVSAASTHFGEVRTYAVQQDIDQLNKAGYHDDSGMLSLRDPIAGISMDAHSIDNFVPNSLLLGQSIMSPENAARYDTHKNMVDLYRDDIKLARTGLSAEWEIPKAITEGAEALGHAAAEKIANTYDTVRKVTVEKAHEVGEFAHTTAETVEHAVDSARKTVTEKVTEGVHATEHAAHKLAEEASRTITSVEHKVSETVSHGVDAARKVGAEASQAIHAASEAVTEKAEHAFETLTHPGSWFDSKPSASTATPTRLDHPSHADNPLYLQARGAVHRLDAEQHRTPDHRSDNIAAALVVAARRDGLSQINHAVLSEDSSRTFGVQGELRSPFKRATEVPTAEAAATSVDKSSMAWEQVAQQHQTHVQAGQQQHQQAQQAKPTLAM
jgi:pimeloyl-ACP methyl ester carboxylesterase